MELLSNEQTKERKKYRFSMTGYKDCNALEVSIYYDKGGYNYWYGKIEKRGYWLSLQPCLLDNHLITTVPMDGVKQFLLEVGRQSQKKFNEATKLVSKETIKSLVEHMQYPINDENIAFILETIQEDIA